MKFCCTSASSSKPRKSLNKNNEKKMKKPKENINHSLSSSSSSIYYTNMSIPAIKKYDSGFSETTTTLSSSSIQRSETILEQILSIERIYFEHLKEYIIKYSRPLRRYLNPDEIVDLFQNIEKISAISESIVRQCEKLLDRENASDIPVSVIYQSWSGVMIDSYNSYLSRSVKAQTTFQQCQNKIAYFLQIPIEFVVRDIFEFIHLPARHICLLNELFQSVVIEHSPVRNTIDWKIIEDIRILARQADVILQSSSVHQHDSTLSTLESSIYYPPNVTLETSQDTTLQSEISPTIVLQRTSREPWEPKQLELSDCRLLLTQMDGTKLSSASPTSTLPLANVVYIQEDPSNIELRLIVAGVTNKSSKHSSIKMMRMYLRFEHQNEYYIWLHHLNNAIQQAKDLSWTKKNELVI